MAVSLDPAQERAVEDAFESALERNDVGGVLAILSSPEVCLILQHGVVRGVPALHAGVRAVLCKYQSMQHVE